MPKKPIISESDLAVIAINTLLDGYAHSTSEIYANNFNGSKSEQENLTDRIQDIFEIWVEAGAVNKGSLDNIQDPSDEKKGLLNDLRNHLNPKDQDFYFAKKGRKGNVYKLNEEVNGFFQRKKGRLEGLYRQKHDTDCVTGNSINRSIDVHIERLHPLLKQLPVLAGEDTQANIDEIELNLLSFTPSEIKLLDSFENINDTISIFEIVSNFKSQELQKLRLIFDKTSKDETIDEQTKYHELKALKNEYHQLETTKLDSLYNAYFLCWFSFHTNRK
ncbi:MAG: hypothetical protein Q7T91_00545 [Sulfuricurvum sp.]|nr:hypothetical protein [Sulfuricurvum sp.]